MISVLQLGTLDYETGLRLQQQLVAMRKDGQTGDVLLLLEHTPVITLGRNAKAANILASPEMLTERGVELFECDRGGDVTFHGPGQLVGYAIFDLRGFPSPGSKRAHLGAVEYVRRLEEVLIRTCADFGIGAERVPGLTGVWTTGGHAGKGNVGTDALARPGGSQTGPSSNPQQAKIAALGVHISRGVTSHGFAVNVNTNLDYFDLIVPCGITSKPVTSIAKELGREVPFEDVVHSVSRNFGTVFGSQILWLESLDALLGHTLGVPLQRPVELRRIHKEEDTFRA
jgi:lipoyl(octanoyl) transferase